jgi:molecular chaperone HscB
MDYFELFGLPVSLKVNKAYNLKKYYQLSKEYHPDHFSLENLSAQENALMMSSEINKAKKILDHADHRLAYYLTTNNLIKPEEKYALSPVFLAEMMDINEELMELEFDKDASKLAGIKLALVEKETLLFEEVKLFFEMDELKIFDNDNLKLKDYYYKKKYLNRILERLNEMM